MFLSNNSVPRVDNAAPACSASLTDFQVISIRAALDGAWLVDRVIDCDGRLALLLTPPGGNETNIAFYVDADHGGLNLSFMADDDLRLRGCYGDSVKALLAAVHAACLGPIALRTERGAVPGTDCTGKNEVA